jgi:uncharacterized protein (DUF58 family)
MTVRSRCLALIAIVGLIAGSLRSQPAVSLVSLTMLLWIVWEWIWFSISTKRELAQLILERSVQNRTESTGVLWSERWVDVILSIRCASGLQGDRILRDVIPENLELSARNVATDVSISFSKIAFLAYWQRRFLAWTQIEEPHLFVNELQIRETTREASLRYSVRCRSAGEVVLPGVRITFQDPMRWFRLDRFVSHRQSFRVLPSYAIAGDSSPVSKRINALPQHGIHRLQQSGIGFELLELREYQPGDPPKSIAWKASARRDKLMSRQYESEIPIRLQLFVDGSVTARIGGYGQRLLDQMVHCAATLANNSISIGDAVGSFLFDESSFQRVPSAFGKRGLFQQLERLADFASNRVPSSFALNNPMLDAAYAVCSERYPEMLDLQVNPISLSFWSYWFGAASRKRVQLSGFLAERYGLSVEQRLTMQLDDKLFAKYVQRFLCETSMPWMSPVISIPELVSQPSAGRNRQLARALTYAASHAKDNEVFVVFVDLICNMSPLDELVTAIKLARSKHHRVALVCPSPTFQRSPTMSQMHVAHDNVFDVDGLRIAAEQIRIHDQADRLKRYFVMLGVPLSLSGEANAIGMVLSEISIARSGRTLAQGVPK